MNKRMQKLLAERQTTVTAMRAMLDAADAATGALTAEDQPKYDAMKAKLATIDASIAEEKALAEAERTAPALPTRTTSLTGQRERAEDDPRRGFANHREYLMAVMDNSGVGERADISDERLRPLALMDKEDKQAKGELAYVLPVAFTPQSLRATAGSDEQGGYADRFGGYAVPTTIAPGMLQVGFEGDPTAGRTQSVPMTSPIVKFNARTDKDHSSSVSGGFTVTRRPETVSIASSRSEMEQVELKATGLFGLAFATEEILTDSPISFAAIIDTGFRTQMPAAILNEKIRGKGGNEFLGVLNSPAKITVSKVGSQTATTINGTNVIAMAARCWGLDQAVWIANHDTRPQLATTQIATGTVGVLLYQPSRGEGFPDMLWGRPVIYTEFAATLGTEGDLMLVNWSQYLEGLYQPLQSAESVHVRFVNHERAFKFWIRNAGAPWWRSALTPAKSTATLSPIVTLETRA
jgi:HK97 family phage major capsid protein